MILNKIILKNFGLHKNEYKIPKILIADLLIKTNDKKLILLIYQFCCLNTGFSALEKKASIKGVKLKIPEILYDLASNDKLSQKNKFRLYKQAADQGDEFAQLNTGWHYFNGKGIKRDVIMAKKYYSLSAKKGNASALYNLGLIEKNLGNSAKMRQYFTAASKCGHKASMVELAKILIIKEKKFSKLTIKLLKTANRLGDFDASDLLKFKSDILKVLIEQ